MLKVWSDHRSPSSLHLCLEEQQHNTPTEHTLQDIDVLSEQETSGSDISRDTQTHELDPQWDDDFDEEQVVAQDVLADGNKNMSTSPDSEDESCAPSGH